MQYFLLLLFFTAVITILTFNLWLKIRNISIPLGILLIYYLSLMGAWCIIYDQTGGDSGLHYQYLFEQMFPVYLDSYYAKMIALYSLFIIVLLLSLTFFIRIPRRFSEASVKRLRLSHITIMMVMVFAGFFSFMIFKDDIFIGLQTGNLTYYVTRNPDNKYFTIGAILNRMCLVPGAIGLAVFFSGPNAKYIVGKSRKLFILVTYLVLMSAMYFYCLILGNKNELFLSLVAGFLFYVVNCPKPKMIFAYLSGVLLMIFIAAVDFFRGIFVSDLTLSLFYQGIVRGLSIPLQSNEMFAAHFSMYGVLSHDIPITYGYSLFAFIVSIIPRIFWQDRPYDIYMYYAQGVNAIEGHGYTVHHATGWYLNFGITGIIIGAILLGWLWAALLNRFYLIKGKRIFWRVFTIIAPWTLVAGLPAFIRAGPEIYKGLIIDSFLVPTFVVAFACTKFKINKTIIQNQSLSN